MGEYLSSPKLDPEILDGDEATYMYGMCSIQGWRMEMEDTHVVVPNIVDGVSLFAVMDGHGGKEVAIFTKKHLPTLLKDRILLGGNLESCLSETLKKIDCMLLTIEGKKELLLYCAQLYTNHSITINDVGLFCGCTCCALLITKDRIIVSNIGDSRAVIYRGQLGIPITEDHKPDKLSERIRIEKAKGFVEANRVNANLNIARTIGDLDYKKNVSLPPEDQLVTSVPDTVNFSLKEEDNFILLACDGIWECLSCQQAVDITQRLIDKYKGLKISKILMRLFEKIVSKNIAESGGLGADNMTAILIKFKK
jgi:serine/threonine protein phosphatase PrpC